MDSKCETTFLSEDLNSLRAIKFRQLATAATLVNINYY